MSDLEPLSDLARELLDEERDAIAARPELSGRVMAKLEAALGPNLGFDANGGGDGGGQGPGEGSGGHGHGGAAPAATGAGASLGGAKLAAVLATTFAVGTGAGVALDRTTAAPAPAPAPATTVTVYLPAPSPPNPAVTSTVTTPASAPSPSASAAASAAPHASSTAAGDPKSDLARERELIDAARAGVARGHADAALSAVNRHEREFPQGQLREEREGLRILALAAQGRTAEARSFAARFRKSYPQSVLMPQVDAALGSP